MMNQFEAIDWERGNITWTFQAAERAQPYYASAAVTENVIVVGSRDKRIHALSRDSGKEIWSFATEGRVDASPVVIGNRVFAPSLDGNLYVLRVADGSQLQKITLDGPISGSPAVTSGRLVLGTQKGTVYCLGQKHK
jgi:outer membrane protein assembly factor BamB